jgi:hypothetical protein
VKREKSNQADGYGTAGEKVPGLEPHCQRSKVRGIKFEGEAVGGGGGNRTKSPRHRLRGSCLIATQAEMPPQ